MGDEEGESEVDSDGLFYFFVGDLLGIGGDLVVPFVRGRGRGCGAGGPIRPKSYLGVL